ALAFRVSLRSTSLGPAILAGLVFGMTSYTVYYYVVYLALFMSAYVVGWMDWISITASPRIRSRRIVRLRQSLAFLFTLLSALAFWIVMTGGASWIVGSRTILVHQPQNALTAMWLVAAMWLLMGWRVSVHFKPVPASVSERALKVTGSVVLIFVVVALPLIWHAGRAVASAEYVTPRYGWRSIPRGIDLVAPFLGNPRHPIVGGSSE